MMAAGTGGDSLAGIGLTIGSKMGVALKLEAGYPLV